MSKVVFLFLGVFFSIASAMPPPSTDGGESENEDWVIEDLVLVKTSLSYIEVHGVLRQNVLFTENSSCKIWAKWFSDDYETEISTETLETGYALSEDKSEPFEIMNFDAHLGAGGYERICVQMKAGNSNYPEWEDIDCIE